MTESVTRWGVLWRSENRLSGPTTHFMWDPRIAGPVLFQTRREAREWISRNYGYIAQRPELHAEPYGWRMPRAVRIRVTLELT